MNSTLRPHIFLQMGIKRHRLSRGFLTSFDLKLEKKHVISGPYMIPIRPMRTTRMPSGILTGSRCLPMHVHQMEIQVSSF